MGKVRWEKFSWRTLEMVDSLHLIIYLPSEEVLDEFISHQKWCPHASLGERTMSVEQGESGCAAHKGTDNTNSNESDGVWLLGIVLLHQILSWWIQSSPSRVLLDVKLLRA